MTGICRSTGRSAMMMALVLGPRMEVQELVQECCKFKNWFKNAASSRTSSRTICSGTTVQELHKFKNYSSRTLSFQELQFKNFISSSTIQVHKPKFLKFMKIFFSSYTVQELMIIFLQGLPNTYPT